jgi:3-dehydroquinate dehydratase-1
MNVPICIPVTGRTLTEFRKNLTEAKAASDWVELRVDSVEGYTEDDVVALKREVSEHTIFTCRRNAEGGTFTGSEPERLAVLQRAISEGFPFVDVELATIETHAFKRHPDGKVIVSYHDFEKTPDYWDLTRIVDDIRSYDPDVIKIATMARSEQDCHVIYRLLANKKGNEAMIAIAMGREGRLTRIVGPLLGSMVTFASLGDATAPGQIDVDTMRRIYQTLPIS